MTAETWTARAKLASVHVLHSRWEDDCRTPRDDEPGPPQPALPGPYPWRDEEEEFPARHARRGPRPNWLIRERHSARRSILTKLERLGRYEVHLDRKLERMLTMLLRLKDLRRTTIES